MKIPNFSKSVRYTYIIVIFWHFTYYRTLGHRVLGNFRIPMNIKFELFKSSTFHFYAHFTIIFGNTFRRKKTLQRFLSQSSIKMLTKSGKNNTFAKHKIWNWPWSHGSNNKTTIKLIWCSAGKDCKLLLIHRSYIDVGDQVCWLQVSSSSKSVTNIGLL